MEIYTAQTYSLDSMPDCQTYMLFQLRYIMRNHGNVLIAR